MNFGERLKRSRKAKKLTQAELAARLDRDFTSISKWENNKAEPDRETLIKLSDILDVKMNWLMGNEKEFTAEEKQVLTKLDQVVPIDQIAKEHDISVHGKVLDQRQKKLFLMYIQTLVEDGKE